jgi:type VI secretion system protein ImpM
MDLLTVPQLSANLPAWFGKLPGNGDFAQRRLAPEFLETWDAWLQREMLQLRQHREDWTPRYLEAPLWYFVLSAGIVNAHPWIGVLMPSVDSVGRYFPLTLATPLLPSMVDISSDLNPAHMHCWWQRSANAALTALDTDQDAAQFDTALHSIFSKPASIEETTPDILPMLSPGQTLWTINITQQPTVAHLCNGLPTRAEFEFLFGYPDAIAA